MSVVGNKTDSQPVVVLNFLYTEALSDCIQQLTKFSQQTFYALNKPSLQTYKVESLKAVFIEINNPENTIESLELVKHIRLRNKTTCIFILTTHAKPLSNINYYLAGADHCLKLPADLSQKKELLSRAIKGSHWKIPSKLFLDRKRLLLSNSTQNLEISYTEMVIIEALLCAKEHIMSQDDIAKTIDPNVIFYDPRALEKTISRLRTKVKKSYNLELILSVRAFGYRLRRDTVIDFQHQ